MINELTKKIVAFRDARDWRQFHTPKDLSAGLAIEAAELQEVFLWQRPEELQDLLKEKKGAIADELADIAWYVLLLANDLDIDLAEAIENKLKANGAKYPVNKAKGCSKKYNEL